MHPATKRILKISLKLLILALPILFAAPQAGAFELAADEGVGVVLGGGGARGFAHLGVLRELQRLHIPIRCIAGTSAGALVGGMYANGLDLDQMAADFRDANWDQMLSGRLPRTDIPYDKKRDDYKNYLDVTFGLQNGQLRVPRSAINSQEIEMFIRKLTRDRQLDSFEKLPIPFRAVATDLANGEAVVFDKGPLAQALRASMAVPGLFDLVETDGRLLVDGGLARNLPIQDARQCAQHLIVVDVGTPPLSKDQINSLFDVVAQTTNLMVSRNVREQMALLQPEDVLIRPDLNGYGAADFVENQAIIQRGNAAAMAQEQALRRFSVSAERYAAWRERLKLPAYPVVDDIQVKSDSRFVNADGLASSVANMKGGETVDAVREKLRALFAAGDYDQLSYAIDARNGRNIMTVMPLEKNIGPNTVHFGLSLNSSTPGDSNFSFLASHQRNWLNPAGGSWRNEMVIGKDKLFKTELYQPWSYDSPLFAAASLSYHQQPLSFYDDNHIKYAEVSNDITMFNADVGTVLGRYGELRLGLFDSRVESYLSLGDSALLSGTINHSYAGVRGKLVFDQFDNPRWPRSGYFMNVVLTSSLPAMGSYTASRDYDAVVEGVKTFGDLTFRLTGKARGIVNRKPDDYRLESLGGFLNLTGYQAGELLGEKVALSRLMVYWRAASLPSALGSGLYAGMSGEVGRVWGNPFDGSTTQWIPAGSVFLAADTIFGPFFLGVGNAKNGKLSGYIYLGADY
ncbi:NTE family protein [Aquitalea magnusonii]|uniref:NTE family protein n=1 Tax=Aquitalea magnusonii TaxID=332411 RepID=A0A318JLC1_9NEIS|nr:NTE family protein [Aquitalea magnusonii]